MIQKIWNFILRMFDVHIASLSLSLRLQLLHNTGRPTKWDGHAKMIDPPQNFYIRKTFYPRGQLFSLFIVMYIVQLYKEDWAIFNMLGCRAVALPGTERIGSIFGLYSCLVNIHAANTNLLRLPRVRELGTSRKHGEEFYLLG